MSSLLVRVIGSLIYEMMRSFSGIEENPLRAVQCERCKFMAVLKTEIFPHNFLDSIGQVKRK